MKHMKSNKLFSRKQFGFISGRSTVLQLIKVLDNWTETMDEGRATDVVYCDFMKAFDRVPHKKLIEKVASYGIQGDFLRWIKDFLARRKQRVLVNGNESEWKAVTSGVPQGSVLGPLLFVLFINDLPEAAKHGSEVYMYADDTKVYREIKENDDCDRLQQDLDGLLGWTDKWMLDFHPDKCKYMRIGRSAIEEKRYRVHNNISKTETGKDIGVIIDNKLKFSEHLSEKINKANKIVGLIRRTFVYLDSPMFKSLYTALVRPHLEYANQVWCPHLIKDIEAVENVQRRATKQLSELKDLPYED